MTELDFPRQLREFLPAELHDDAALTTRPALQLRHPGEGDTVIGHFGGAPKYRTDSSGPLTNTTTSSTSPPSTWSRCRRRI
ncbi:hypothetical protein OIE68_11810 [Nocardia vinacea]|uniref:Uncharacterized protein n=1 Tax=Nocardia vinacea TaxID=96468 RepID=A0ABZ1YWB0_9NOCA|nr:hypothetical protein OIE68_11810 [Nocardia vinacea]